MSQSAIAAAASRRALPDARVLIGGEWMSRGSAGSFGHVSQITGKVQAQVALAGAEQVDQAVAAAKAAFPAWRALAGDKRRRILQRIEELIERDRPILAELTTLELGMPTAAASHYPLMAAAYFGYYAGWCDKIEGATIPLTPPTGFNYTLMEPYGVIGVITTWNGPLASVGMKVAPALAAGNTIVLKSPEIAPFVLEHFALICEEAGLPAGVLNIVPGLGEAGDRLVRHPDVAKVTFTGGGVTARKIMEAAAASLTPLALELGGKSANLMFSDAELDKAVPNAVMHSIVANAGQGCSFPTRLLVERSIYPEVVERLAAVAAGVKLGDPFDPATQMGPVVNQAACTRIMDSIEKARVGSGAKLVAGGERLGGAFADGFFIKPTIFADVDPADELATHEVFGPVLTVTPFADEAEAIAIANGTVYGLAAYIQSRDIARVNRVVPQLKAGTVHVNGKSAMPPQAPFGGYGESGFGREGGKAGLDEFLQIKNVFVQA